MRKCSPARRRIHSTVWACCSAACTSNIIYQMSFESHIKSYIQCLLKVILKIFWKYPLSYQNCFERHIKRHIHSFTCSCHRWHWPGHSGTSACQAPSRWWQALSNDGKPSQMMARSPYFKGQLPSCWWEALFTTSLPSRTQPSAPVRILELLGSLKSRCGSSFPSG